MRGKPKKRQVRRPSASRLSASARGSAWEAMGPVGVGASSLAGAPELLDAAARKHYVDVIVRVRDDGRVIPLSVCWEDGRTFRIDEVIGEPASSAPESASARTLRYAIRIGERRTHLFAERDADRADGALRWYVVLTRPRRGRRGG